jgi:hypothetical protein
LKTRPSSALPVAALCADLGQNASLIERIGVYAAVGNAFERHALAARVKQRSRFAHRKRAGVVHLMRRNDLRLESLCVDRNGINALAAADGVRPDEGQILRLTHVSSPF